MNFWRRHQQQKIERKEKSLVINSCGVGCMKVYMNSDDSVSFVECSQEITLHQKD